MSEQKPAAETNQGITCPKCGCKVTRVSYRRSFGRTFRRVRICGSPICGHRFVTRETT